VRFHLGNNPSPAQLWQDFLVSPPKRIAVDTETPSLSDRSLLGVGVALSGQDAFYLTPDDESFPRLVLILQDPSIRKAFHNAPYDLRVMRYLNVDTHNIDDTAIMSRLAGPFHKPVWTSNTLEDISFWVDRQTEQAKGFMNRFGQTRMDTCPLWEVARKCCIDAQATYLLIDYLMPRVNQEYYEVERQLLPMLETISSAGIKLDQERREQLETIYTREYQYYRNVAEQQFGFNPGSGYQVGYILAKRGNFLPLTKEKTQLATDAKTLKKIRDPLVGLILNYRHVAKMLSTYILPYAGMDRAYTTLHNDAVTGRVSSTSAGKSEPDRNLQNIPKRVEKGAAPTVRGMFIPDNGMFTRIDASQIELRILAHLSQDRHMLDVLYDPNGDIHADTMKAMSLHGEVGRIYSKTFNFAMIYGGNEYTVADNIGTSDIPRVRRNMELWMNTYPQAAQWMVVQQEEGLANGWVETLYGRRMLLPMDMLVQQGGEKHIRNCAVNYPIQGTAAEIFKRVMIELLPLLDVTRLQIHDEELFDGAVEIPSGLESVSPVHTPIKVEQIERWS